MSNTIKNPAPTAIGDRASKFVKVGNSDKPDIIQNAKARQCLVLVWAA